MGNGPPSRRAESKERVGFFGQATAKIIRQPSGKEGDESRGRSGRLSGFKHQQRQGLCGFSVMGVRGIEGKAIGFFQLKMGFQIVDAEF